MNPVGTESARPQTAPDAFTPLDPTAVSRWNRLFAFWQQVQEEDREQRRYAAAAESSEACLCTPVDYGSADLSHIPQRILDIDYGCGDPTRYAEPGETVLDLGSGSGKHCFMIARKVGPEGRVIGVDKTPQMLELARGAVDEVVQALGYRKPNFEFRRGHIENLRWGLDHLEKAARRFPPTSYENLERLEAELESEPLIESNSIDLVVSNCVLNLVKDNLKQELFSELHRVLRAGGRAVISDIVAARDVPESMKGNEELWTGCLAGALRRDRFLDAFIAAGFYGVEELNAFYWRSEEGVAFYSVTVVAYKGKEGPCWETYRNAFYKGPFRAVEDDDHHRFERGVPVPVCEKTARILSRAPYGEHFLVSEPLAEESAQIPFDCSGADGRGDIPDDIRQAMQESTGLVTDGNGCDPATGCC